jgi:hypothetical protein
MLGITPPEAMVTWPRRRLSSSSFRIASWMWRGMMRVFLLSRAAFPASSRISAVRYSITAAMYTAAPPAILEPWLARFRNLPPRAVSAPTLIWQDLASSRMRSTLPVPSLPSLAPVQMRGISDEAHDLWMRPTGNWRPARDERVLEVEPFSRPLRFGFPLFLTTPSCSASTRLCQLVILLPTVLYPHRFHDSYVQTCVQYNTPRLGTRWCALRECFHPSPGTSHGSRQHSPERTLELSPWIPQRTDRCPPAFCPTRGTHSVPDYSSASCIHASSFPALP